MSATNNGDWSVPHERAFEPGYVPAIPPTHLHGFVRSSIEWSEFGGGFPVVDDRRVLVKDRSAFEGEWADWYDAHRHEFEGHRCTSKPWCALLGVIELATLAQDNGRATS